MSADGGAEPSGSMDREAAVYAVRFSRHARREAIESAVRLTEQSANEERSLSWYLSLEAEAGTLATNPRRFVVRARESRLLGETVRALIYRYTPGSTAYHLFYTVEDDSDDGPRVTILHVRHAARRPLTPGEVRQISADR